MQVQDIQDLSLRSEIPLHQAIFLHLQQAGVRSWGPIPGASVLPFQAETFGDPLDIDASTYKDWICSGIIGDFTVNLNDATDGDAGMLELDYGLIFGRSDIRIDVHKEDGTHRF